MALPKGKGDLAAILGGGSPGEDDAPMDVGTGAAQALADAVAAKDPVAIKTAFRDLYNECAAEASDDSED